MTTESKIVTLSGDPEVITVRGAGLGMAAQAVTDTEARILELQKIAGSIRRVSAFYDSGRYPLPDIDLVANVVSAWEDWNKTNPQ